MTPEKQRITIAEACGWQYVNFNYILQGVWQNVGSFPDYLNDLNACHEMEKLLVDAFERRKYYQTLDEITGDQWATIVATAAQRCEAFLKTVNLWKPQ